MKLTKDQRFTAYCIMLAEAKPFARRYYYDKGFCHLIQETFGLTNRPGSVIYTNVRAMIRANYSTILKTR